MSDSVHFSPVIAHINVFVVIVTKYVKLPSLHIKTHKHRNIYMPMVKVINGAKNIVVRSYKNNLPSWKHSSVGSQYGCNVCGVLQHTLTYPNHAQLLIHETYLKLKKMYGFLSFTQCDTQKVNYLKIQYNKTSQSRFFRNKVSYKKVWFSPKLHSSIKFNVTFSTETTQKSDCNYLEWEPFYRETFSCFCI